MKIKTLLPLFLFVVLASLALVELQHRWVTTASPDKSSVPYTSKKIGDRTAAKKKTIDYQKMVEAAGKIRH